MSFLHNMWKISPSNALKGPISDTGDALALRIGHTHSHTADIKH